MKTALAMLNLHSNFQQITIAVICFSQTEKKYKKTEKKP